MRYPGELARDSGSTLSLLKGGEAIRFEGFSFGSIWIDGLRYDYDVVIDRGEVRKRKKKASKKFRLFG